MKGSIGQLMKQAQKMQENLQKAQEELAAMEVTGEAVGGLVKVVMTCRHVVRKSGTFWQRTHLYALLFRSW